jgi:5-methylcytosine-specific restriction endonuclease McrA
MTTHKTCTKCKQSKAMDEFHRNKNTEDGRCYNCKQCVSDYQRRYYSENSDRVKVRAKEWHWANQERAAENSRKWYANNKGQAAAYKIAYQRENRERIAAARREYYRRNRAAILERVRQYRLANADRVAEYDSVRKRESYKADPERIKARNRRWWKGNTDKARTYCAARRTRLRNGEGEFTDADIRAMLKAQSGRCVYCRANIADCYTVDHVIPLSRGGSNWPANLQLLCASCNSSKCNRTHDEYLEYLSIVTSAASQQP